ncbi:MAG: serine protease [Planctomycetaceae bacterium]|nr:serine protease [Planctomycetaceae bacterium]
MPRIANRFLDCSIYLYPTEEMATNGESHGGSGFLAAIPGFGDEWLLDGKCPRRDFYHCYAISNKHVAEKHPIVRLNREKTSDSAERTSVIPFHAEDWFLSPEHDIAIVPVDFATGLKYLFIDATTRFLTKEKAALHDVGIGDEVFMVGRFINHEGRQRNNPSVRFGHIGMMPADTPDDPGDPRELETCFVIETHSIPGYSGSPVFVRPFAGPKLEASHYDSFPTNTHVYMSVPPSFMPPQPVVPAGPWLLGIQKAYIHHEDRDKKVKSNTGMSAVVPAWHILDLLNSEKMRLQRKAEQEQLLRRIEREGSTETA